MSKTTEWRTEVKEALECLMTVPPDWDKINSAFEQQSFTPSELAYMAYNLVDDCRMEVSWGYILALGKPEPAQETLHSFYLADCIQFLVDKGLDPNICVEGDSNVLWLLESIDMPMVSAKVARLLLEHGADPNLALKGEPDGLFAFVADNFLSGYTYYGITRSLYLVLVLMAYGGCYFDGSVPIKMKGKKDPAIFKDFERFGYRFKHSRKGAQHDWTLRIFDLETGEDAAIWQHKRELCEVL